MKEKAIIDTSVLIKIILYKDINLLHKLHDNFEIFVPVNILEETAYILIRESIKELFNEERFFEIKKIFEKEDVDVINKRFIVLNNLIDIFKVLPINKEIFEISKEIIKKYKLLPNDSLIIASAKYYRINTLITYDEDFNKIDFLTILQL